MVCGYSYSYKYMVCGYRIYIISKTYRIYIISETYRIYSFIETYRIYINSETYIIYSLTHVIYSSTYPPYAIILVRDYYSYLANRVFRRSRRCFWSVSCCSDS